MRKKWFETTIKPGTLQFLGYKKQPFIIFGVHDDSGTGSWFCGDTICRMVLFMKNDDGEYNMIGYSNKSWYQLEQRKIYDCRGEEMMNTILSQKVLYQGKRLDHTIGDIITPGFSDIIHYIRENSPEGVLKDTSVISKIKKITYNFSDSNKKIEIENTSGKVLKEIAEYDEITEVIDLEYFHSLFREDLHTFLTL